jgi:hypothetical protein
MEIQYSVVINSMGGGSVALVLRSWTLDEEGNQTQIASEVKSGISMEQAFQDAQAFVQEVVNG